MLGWNNPLPIGQSVPRPRALTPGCSGVLEPASYMGLSRARELNSSTLATTRVFASRLATARILCFTQPPTPVSIQRPHCQLGINRWQRSQRQGQRLFPDASDSGITQWQWKDGIAGLAFLGFLGFLYSLMFFVHSYYLLSQCIGSTLENWSI